MGMATLAFIGCKQLSDGQTVSVSKETIMDKIKGGWVGKAIGCTYGGPTEFKYCGTKLSRPFPPKANITSA